MIINSLLLALLAFVYATSFKDFRYTVISGVIAAILTFAFVQLILWTLPELSYVCLSLGPFKLISSFFVWSYLTGFITFLSTAAPTSTLTLAASANYCFFKVFIPLIIGIIFFVLNCVY